MGGKSSIIRRIKKYYDEGAYGGKSFLSFLKKPSLTLERCQALARWRFVLATMQSYKPKTLDVCDVGAGYGCTLEIAKNISLNVKYSAYESSPAFKKRIAKMNGTILPDLFQDHHPKSYDLVWASHILEHYADPDILLKKMHRLMNEKGYGFIEVPCLDLEFKNDWAPHLLFFSVIGLNAALARNGFKVLRSDSVGPLRKQAASCFQGRVHKSTKLDKVKEIFKKQNDLKQDLNRFSLLKEWNLENYGGERSWIRAIFCKG